ncbi:thymidylate synthase [uncultured Nonlabens sp.]|uniref:thymidylate synthase n=1 Tax=uncultured Nonlabens sp. TaxID=859306 RepID=UPI00261A5129|nr:thymidylate synthase [uncultured Nonlabens sp.]
MDFKDYNNVFTYSFGKIYCYNNYVVSHLHTDVVVNNEIATSILRDLKEFYGKDKIVFISNREFGHGVDPKVYKLVNPKMIVGIAIIGTSKEQKMQAASEQSLYNGSFGYFNNVASAIEWASSFAPENTDSISS